MDQDVQPKAKASPGDNRKPVADVTPPDVVDVGGPVDDADHARDQRTTRVVHIVLGLVIACVGAWLLYRSITELAFRGPNGEPGPGYLPVLLTSCLIVLGLLLTGAWAFGGKARRGEAPTLSLHPRQMGRALLVWGALVVCGFLIEPLGFLLAGEVFVLLIMAIERIRSIPLIVTLLLVPPAMYVLFDTLLEVQLPGGTLWY
ncbi:tripartite tricarboxylate transporter TctB family protein [Mycolicibacterium stellerae]|uniref:tripartite tricarboxylate transporter TctB family protein n=1 Tax=Mycolicibacterium stellerae TaxID=2358193 RepID=UPI0013DD94FD|nr:tripartite tricarboxylate transporter TctB family protein [Mycolicibacterium stellerae]